LAICCKIALAAVMLGGLLRVQTIGFAASQDGIGAKSINSYLIEQLTRSGHLLGRPETSSEQISFWTLQRETAKTGRGAEQ
jgi:hypothetical protein